MKNLKDLKEEILNNKINSFYVFYGEDYGLRQHYIKEISKHFNKITTLYNLQDYIMNQSGNSLFKTNTLFIVHGDIDFAKRHNSVIERFISKLDCDTVIACYDEEIKNSTLFRDFDSYITNFPCVQDKIALQFVDSEITLSQSDKEELIRNCENNYNNILLEADKIKCYAKQKNISEQASYEVLYNNHQLLYKYPQFHSYQFMDDVLKGNRKSLDYWYCNIKVNFLEDFWIASESMMQDFIIAYLIKQHGRYQGGNIAYDLGLNWGRVKAIRDFIIPFNSSQLLEKAYKMACLDKNIKFGLIEKEKLIDYFMCLIF